MKKPNEEELFEITNIRNDYNKLIRLIAEKDAFIEELCRQRDYLENKVNSRTKELSLESEKNINVLESIIHGFVAIDKEWRYTYINKHQYMFNKKREELIGKNIWKEFPMLVNSTFNYKLHEAMFQRVPVVFETDIDYLEKRFEIRAYPYDDGICIFTRDITERNKYEQELNRLSGLTMISQMAAGISHEIRNPMTTVRGYLQLMKMKGDCSGYTEQIDLMIEEIDRANSIITEYLTMGNNNTAESESCNLNIIVSALAPLIRADAMSQEKYVLVDTDDIPEIIINRKEIRQLILNLCRNGLEAMPKGKSLIISTYSEDDYVVLAVKDQGSGISPEVMQKLGTPFFTTKENGTGLGLCICNGIATRHNAQIDINTGPTGSTFMVKFKSYIY